MFEWLALLPEDKFALDCLLYLVEFFFLDEHFFGVGCNLVKRRSVVWNLGVVPFCQRSEELVV